MKYFVARDSVVRQIWGSGDTILFIFAGAAAEFSLNKAVDWLYFTGRLPADPIARLFSTVNYARAIVFSENNRALQTIDAMTAIHSAVESQRGASIPDWAYRDVLFMLIDYSIRAFEVLERPLQLSEKNEVFEVFHRVGIRMGLKGLPATFSEWENMRQEHLHAHLEHSAFTDDLFSQYRKHLDFVRFNILLQAQTLVVPEKVGELLGYRKTSWLTPIIGLYKLSRKLNADRLLKNLLLPFRYKGEIMNLDRDPTG